MCGTHTRVFHNILYACIYFQTGEKGKSIYDVYYWLLCICAIQIQSSSHYIRHECVSNIDTINFYSPFPTLRLTVVVGIVNWFAYTNLNSMIYSYRFEWALMPLFIIKFHRPIASWIQIVSMVTTYSAAVQHSKKEAMAHEEKKKLHNKRTSDCSPNWINKPTWFPFELDNIFDLCTLNV